MNGYITKKNVIDVFNMNVGIIQGGLNYGDKKGTS